MHLMTILKRRYSKHENIYERLGGGQQIAALFLWVYMSVIIVEVYFIGEHNFYLHFIPYFSHLTYLAKLLCYIGSMG